MEVGVACPAFFCSHDGELKGLCHGDDFCVVARRKQLRTVGRILEKRFEVKQTGHIGFGASDKNELKILNRTIKIDVMNDVQESSTEASPQTARYKARSTKTAAFSRKTDRHNSKAWELQPACNAREKVTSTREGK